MRHGRLAALSLAILLAGCGTHKQMTAPLTDATGTNAAIDSHAGPGGDHEGGDHDGGAFRTAALYTLTNDAVNACVLRYPRQLDGTLGAPAAFPTGGRGTGAGLGDQGAIAIDHERGLLFAVDAGSNDIATFRLAGNGLTLIGRTPSGGTTPVSVTVADGRLFVAHSGGDSRLAGFRVAANGALIALPQANAALGTGVGVAEVAFAGDEKLIVTEKAANTLAVFTVRGGTLSAPRLVPSSGQTPFGFAVAHNGTVVVSEAFGGAANASAMSSYRVNDGGVRLVSGSVPTKQTAACWVAISGDDRHAYTTDAGSAVITGYAIGARGELTRLEDDGVSAHTLASPIDLTFAPGGRTLYVLTARGHSIDAYRRGPDGKLTPLASVTGLPAGGAGLLAD